MSRSKDGIVYEAGPSSPGKELSGEESIAGSSETGTEGMGAKVPAHSRTGRSPLARLVSGSATYGLGSILQKTLGFLLIPIYTRFLTPADYGIVAVTTSVGAALTVLFGMGLHGAVTRQYYDYRYDRNELREYVGTVFLFFIAVGLVVLGTMRFFGPAIFDRMLGSVPFHPYIELTLWTAFCTAGVTHLLSLYRAREQPVSYVVVSLTSTLLALGSVLYFVVVLQRGAVGKIQGDMWGALIAFGIVVVLMTREVSPSFSSDKLARALSFGLPLIPHLVFAWMLGVADRIILERMTSLDEVGLYTLGYQIGMILALVVSAINSAWTPIYYDTAETDPDAPRVISRICTTYVGGLSLLAVALIVVAPDLLNLLADASYSGAHRVVPLVVVGYVFQGMYFMSVTALFYTKRTRVLPLITGLAALANVGANLLLVPRIGMMGSAWATFVSFLVLLLGTNVLAQSVYRIPYEYSKLAVPVGLLVVISLFFGYIVQLPWLVSMLVRASLLLLFAGVLLGFGVLDWRVMKRLLSERGRAHRVTG